MHSGIKCCVSVKVLLVSPFNTPRNFPFIQTFLLTCYFVYPKFL